MPVPCMPGSSARCARGSSRLTCLCGFADAHEPRQPCSTAIAADRRASVPIDGTIAGAGTRPTSRKPPSETPDSDAPLPKLQSDGTQRHLRRILLPVFAMKSAFRNTSEPLQIRHAPAWNTGVNDALPARLFFEGPPESALVACGPRLFRHAGRSRAVVLPRMVRNPFHFLRSAF